MEKKLLKSVLKKTKEYLETPKGKKEFFDNLEKALLIDKELSEKKITRKEAFSKIISI